MDFAELDATVQTLTRDRDRLREDLDRLRREFEQLNGKLRYPGTKFLVDLEYKLVYEATVSAPPGVPTVLPVFETLQGTIHACYVLSAYATANDADVVVVDGTIIVAPAAAVAVAIGRQRQSNPPRIQASVVMDNSSGAAVTIAVRVWRRLGMGS